MTSFVHGLGHRQARYCLHAMCDDGAMTNATIPERCP